ncbi:MAG: hypothetical protein JST39_23045, partial [Bacteroidetes bacterium]|nr:hypothetical protein [Bacteroidota bacterium]
MKYILSALAVFLSAVLLLSFYTTRNYYNDILKELSIQDAEAKEYIFGNFREGNLGFPYSAAIKSLVPGRRATAVREMGDYIRRYAASAEFIQQYRAAREAAKPEAPAGKEE